MSDNEARQKRQRLLESNVAKVDAEAAAAVERGLPRGEIVAVVADLREPLAQPFLSIAAERHGIAVDDLVAKVAGGSTMRTWIGVVPRAVAVASFEASHAQLSQALAQFPATTDRIWVVVIAAGSAALVSRALR